MLRSKKDVERHVVDILGKIDSENEKNLRGYTFARLFFQVRDYETAQKYLFGFLSVRDHHAPAHKLMAQLYEATDNPESALQSYKRSLEIDPRQGDIVLYICQLYTQLPVDHETAKYWADRAEQIYPHNEIVFKLRECLVSAEGDPDHQELENLIATELVSQPKNIDLRIKLLRLYLDTERVKEAYEHATLIERKLFLSRDDWYYTLSDIFEAYQEEFPQDLDSQFFIHYLTALDNLVHLNLSEPYSRKNGNKSSSLSDAVDAIFLFDKNLKKATEKGIKEGSWIYFMHHMRGQLFFYMASVLLKKAKMDQGNKKEALRFSAGLALLCYTIKPNNLLQETWFSQMNENQKVFTNFFQQASLRTAFIGRVIKNMCKEDKSNWLQKMKSDVCISQVKERIFNRIFSSVPHKESLSSYFIGDSTFENTSLEFPSDNALKEYDKSAYKLCSSSLHHLVWLEFHRRDDIQRFLDDYLSEIFKGLQYSSPNLSNGSCESLCILDLEAYLWASVYQAESEIEKKKTLNNNWFQDLYCSCPPDIADAMCSKQQAAWWRIAHGLHTCTIKEKLGECRQVLQNGLEVIRGIGNHGMEVQLVVHLSRLFTDKADFLMKDMKSFIDDKMKKLPENIAALQSRATHYWNLALGMLEKLSIDGSIKIPKERMFIGFEKTLSKTEIRAIQEDGRLYLAVQLMESDKLNEAAEILSKLSSPHGSFYLALTLKKFASQEGTFSNKRTVFLTKAQSAIHETMDRIKDDKGHPLNKEIHIVLEDIENELGTVNSISNGNNEDTDESDSYKAISDLNSSVYATPDSFKSNLHSTPKPSSKFMSTKSKLHSNGDYSKHFEPSPERLDAQIRALALNQDTVIKTIMEQNKSLLETNKTIVDTLQRNNEVLSELKKQLEELKIADSKNPSNSGEKQYLQAQGDYENFDPNSVLEFYEENNDYRTSAYNYNPSSRMVQDATSLNYVVRPTLQPRPPPLNHYNYQYASHTVLPATPLPERPQFYHPPPGQSLPFSEGQQLPQFHFHVASPVIKSPAPIISHISSIPQTVTLAPPSLPPINVQQPPSVGPTSSGALPMTTLWTKSVGVPHAFQIPLPPPVPFVSSSNIVPQPVTAVSTCSIEKSHTTLKNMLMAPTSGDVAFSQTLQYPSTVPQSTAGAVSLFSGISKAPEHLNVERPRCASAGSPEIDGQDLEREVMGDFKPLIPLPAEVAVETGEEEEMVLFEDRAKLYRYVDQEWKERGTGVVKILYHDDTKRVRLLMRRDQVYKVCANHYITSNMEVKPLKNSDRAWTWVAQDFADEELKPEQFCIRFKTTEIALNFKVAFEKAINIAKDSDSKEISHPHKPITSISPNSQKLFGTRFLPKSGSWTCSTCYIINGAEKFVCVACDTKKPGHISTVTSSNSIITTPDVSISSMSPYAANFAFKMPALNINQFTFGTEKVSHSNKSSSEISDKSNSTPKSVFGGFTFSTSPTILQTPDPGSTDREILLVSTKSKNGPQVIKVSNSKTSPFSTFSFTSPPANSSNLSTFLQSSDTSINVATMNDSKLTQGITPFTGFSPSPVSSTVGQPPCPSKELFKKDIDLSKLSQFSTGFSLKQSVLSVNSTEPSPGKNLTDIQSLVQNINPTFNSKDSSIVNNTSPLNKSNSPEKQAPLLFSPITSNDPILTKVSLDGAPEEFIPTAEFKPVVPLPALVDIKTGEEDEERKFCERAKLFRYDSETKEWKERGTGELKILYLQESQKYRILMRRDQVLKICANHYILPEMKLTPLSSSDKSWVWFAQDFSDGDLIQEKFAAKFKTVEIAKHFFNVFDKCQTELRLLEKEMPAFDVCQGNKDSFQKLFNTSLDSWQCTNCNRYNSNLSSCVYCKTPIGNKVTELVSTQKKDNIPLSELFKPAVDSWECSMCYVRNMPVDLRCISCESVKPGSTSPQASDSNILTTNKTIDIIGKFPFNNLSLSDAQTFSFGSPNNSGNGFVFGSKPTVQPSTFTFGQSTLTKTDHVIGFKPPLPTTNSNAVFGESTQKPVTSEPTNFPIPLVTTAPTYVFGSSETGNFNFSSSKQSDPESVEFRFGSPQKYEFNFSGVRPRSPSKTPKSPRSPATPDVDEDDEVVSSDADNIYFTPVIPLPPKVDIKTGEENEKVLFCKRGKLFRFAEGEWKERGLGDIKILFDESLKKVRLLMRREQVLKVCLNHYLFKEIKFEFHGEKSLTWAATDFSENEATPELFAVRFKNGELAQEFKNAIDEGLNIISDQKSQDTSDKLKNFSFKLDTSSKIESNFTTGSLSSRFGTCMQEKSIFGNITEDKASAFSFSNKDKSTNSFFGQNFGNVVCEPTFGEVGFDVEIIYEALPTPEKITAAKKLKLPKTFYLYENKEPCPGCRGCTDTIPPYKGDVAEADEKVVNEDMHFVNAEDKLSLFNPSISTVSFTDLAAKSNFSISPQSSYSKHVFAGAGTRIFANLTTNTEDADDTVAENPDVHFEPVIPLPDLIEVKTGEEDESPIFVNRAKLFRFDGTTKQWKERGIGDIKILSHKEKTRFRIILRRDQVHNIACNHCITEDMSFVPLSTSENAVCWNAIDNSDGPAKASKFAVKFKAMETLEKFKRVFNECLKVIKNPPKTVTENAVSESSVKVDDVKLQLAISEHEVDLSSSTTANQQIVGQNLDEVSEEDDDDDELLFEKRVSFEIFDTETSQFKSAGMGPLKITYDDSVYGYHICVTSDQNEIICDHVIAVQNCLRVEGKKAIWSALDMSVQPPKRRQFRATFSSIEAVNEFHMCFEEGKESAVHSGIVEEDDFQRQ